MVLYTLFDFKSAVGRALNTKGESRRCSGGHGSRHRELGLSVASGGASWGCDGGELRVGGGEWVSEGELFYLFSIH